MMLLCKIFAAKDHFKNSEYINNISESSGKKAEYETILKLCLYLLLHLKPYFLFSSPSNPTWSNEAHLNEILKNNVF